MYCSKFNEIVAVSACNRHAVDLEVQKPTANHLSCGWSDGFIVPISCSPAPAIVELMLMIAAASEEKDREGGGTAVLCGGIWLRTN